MNSASFSGIVTVLLAFITVFLLTIASGEFFNGWRLKRIAASKVFKVGSRQRVRKAVRLKKPSADTSRVLTLLQSLSNVALPAGGWEDDNARLKFLRAGFRHKSASKIYFSVKTISSLALPFFAAVTLSVIDTGFSFLSGAVIMFTCAVIGYYGPDLFLKWRTSLRQTEMRNVLPDLIDLLVICTEAGLALDLAISRVTREIQRSSPALAEEFFLLTLEVRAGGSRESALRSLALRANVDEVSSLVSVLIQADRFGTSIGDALRVQSEVSRVRRMQRAEEMASKIPVKMLIPLILLIFPALMMVLLGPAVLQITRAFAD